MAGFPDFVYKHYHKPLVGAAASFADVMLAGQSIAPALSLQRVQTVWPLVAYGGDSAVEGYVMRRISDRFTVELETPQGSLPVEATLDHALRVGPNKAFYPRREVTAEERFDIVTRAGVFLDTLHRHDFVYGDLSFKNLRFALDPVELLVMDLDPVHRISAPLIPEKDIVHTPDWADPHAPGQIPLGFDLDRFRYALLVYRMLIAHSPSAPLPDDPSSIAASDLDAVPASARRAVVEMIRRAKAGGRGSRPPIAEWLDVLCT